MRDVNVSIFPGVAQALEEISFRHAPDETGGVLVGTRSYQDDVLEYNIFGVLGVADFEEFKGIYTASPTSFVCNDRLGWANLALKAVETFGMSYIGDWHSHPRCSLTTLSSQDISFIAEQFMLGQFRPYPPLHVLLSWTSIEPSVNISANIMLGKYIAVIKPQILEN